MSTVAVHIHPSQFPASVEAAFCESLDRRRMNHQFHYSTPMQSARWLRVHEAYSPARQDDSCLAAYEHAFAATADGIGNGPVTVVGLGCGGGQKEAALLRALLRHSAALPLRYVPADVSPGLALVARAAALATGAVPAEEVAPVVLDLAATKDWREALEGVAPGSARRIVTFFGMLPNFSPNQVLTQLSALLAPGDLLLVSANLAPGSDYGAGVRQVLPLYDNAPTAEWLFAVLEGVGISTDDGRIEFGIAACPEGSGLQRIEADFVFQRANAACYAGRSWPFGAGDRFGLFFSYRHTPERVSALFAPFGLALAGQWLNAGGDEGVFLLTRSGMITS